MNQYPKYTLTKVYPFIRVHLLIKVYLSTKGISINKGRETDVVEFLPRGTL